MYAVIETGGKQYRVEQGDVIDVELVSSGENDDKVTFDRVLMVGGEGAPTVGKPVIEGASVTGELIDRIRAEKIRVFKKKRRKGYKRLNGHRQNLMRVRIDSIQA